MELTIDFETRSRVDLSDCGMYRYAEDESTEIFMLAVKVDDQPTKLWVPYDFQPYYSGESLTDDQLKELVASAKIIHAHNAGFERVIWLNVMSRHGFEDIPLEKWSCTAARVAALTLPRSLEGACAAINCPIQKDEEGKALMKKMCKPRKPTKKDPSEWIISLEHFNRLARYCMVDVEAEYALGKIVPELTERERKLWLLDQQINDRGMAIDVDSVKEILEIIATTSEQLNEEFFQITGIDSPTKIAQTRAWLKDHGLDLESLDAEAVENALELENLSSDNRRVLEIRQSLSKSSTAKYEKMLGCVNSDNRARGMLLYCGAAMTGRWSSKLIQLQNLPRGLIKSEVALFNLKTGDANINDVMESASSSIRPMMWSKDDNLVCADQAQIEARVIAWLAGDEQLLSDFAAGKKIYEMTASRLYAIRIEDVTKDQRQVGKAASLACGFQGGVAAFHRFGKQSGLKVTDEEAERNVKLWRESNPMIVKLWRELEACAKKAIKNPGTITGYGKIKYGFKNGSLLCKLPSGRILHYHKAHMENKYIEKLDCEREVIVAMVFDEDSNAYVSRALYGGLLAQRATQATARDVIAENMLAATEAGFKIVLTVHDEIVTEGGDLETLLSILRKSPDWASGLPLDAAGWIGKRYKKD